MQADCCHLGKAAYLTAALSAAVMHVALEYAVPSLGHLTDLMYGGLGKVVEMFIRYSTKPILVCAPLYKPFFNDAGEQGAHEGTCRPSSVLHAWLILAALTAAWLPPAIGDLADKEFQHGPITSFVAKVVPPSYSALHRMGGCTA
jgi:hypothetical protein